MTTKTKGIRFYALLLMCAHVAGCARPTQPQWPRLDEKDVFLFCGMPTRLLAKEQGDYPKFAPHVALSDRLTQDEWERVRSLLTRIPEIDWEITHVSDPRDMGPITILTVHTHLYEITLSWNDKEARWQVSSMYMTTH